LGYFGLYNQVSLGGGSRYDVAEEFINLLGLQSIIKLNKVGSAYFSQEFFAPRPQSEKLINLKLESRGLNQMRHWKDCLKEYSKVFLNHYGKI
jgi:dTDP-4-dehydrorhamnose reductase